MLAKLFISNDLPERPLNASLPKGGGAFLRLGKRQILLGGNQVRYRNELALARGMGAAAVPTLLGRPKAAVTLQCDHPHTAHQSIDLIASQVPLDDIEAGYGGAEHRRRALNRLTEHCVGVPRPQARRLTRCHWPASKNHSEQVLLLV